jgi:primosomal protein N' (replication factor Y) (superfamily II helicase)
VSVRSVDVALPLPLQTGFSYAVPDEMPFPARGCRVLAPFGSRRIIGVVTGPGEAAASERTLKDLLDVVDETPLLAPPLLDLCAWVASHYLAPPGECYRLALPPAGVRASRTVVTLTAPVAPGDDPLLDELRGGSVRMATLARKLGRDPSARLKRLQQAGRVRIEQDLKAPGFRELQAAELSSTPVVPRGRAQAEVITRLRAAGGRAVVSELIRDRPNLRGAITRLAELGALRLVAERDVRGPEVVAGGSDLRPEPSADQRVVLDALVSAVRARLFAPILLHGVTGSGKTEVYFRAAETAIEEGRGALLLVPEISLTPLLVRAAVARFGRTVAVQHSELSVGERHDQWWRIREGEARIVIGARSAVFAPLPDLGLIVVDEEHEGSYKQEDSPRYHARDVAVVRARLEGVPVVLGSATPSRESYQNALKGKYLSLSLPNRIGSRPLASVEIVDRRAALRSGSDPILTPTLVEALERRLRRREQALLLLNRRGYATSLLCRECGVQAGCPNCSVSLVLHQGGRRAQCHYCGHEIDAPRACLACKGEYLKLTGYGTEKVVEAVRAALPSARVSRLDRDLAARRGEVARILTSFESGEIDVLVGTQMIAKGHDFPNVTLVGVVDADVGLGMPDFRAAERVFQLLTQVAGRAGRGAERGEVVLQSHLPDHYALELARAQNYPGFFEHEMEYRRTMSYPPVATLVNLILRSEDARTAAEHADVLARALRERAPGRFRVLGPAKAPLARLRQEHRFQILLKGDRVSMREAVRAALVQRFGPTRWPGVAVDVDAINVM